MKAVEQFFLETYGRLPAATARAPGRLELLGNHTDYNEGLVLSLAIDRHIFMAVSARDDGRIALASADYPEREEFFCDGIEFAAGHCWTHYVKGVLLQFAKRGGRFSGFDAAVTGTIPAGAGLSSSAALEVAAAMALRRLFPYTAREGRIVMLPPQDREAAPLSAEAKRVVAEVCQAAESECVGVRCGLLDQLSSLFGKAGQAMEIDFRSLRVSHWPFPAGLSVVVCNSGVQHALVAGEYNERRRLCESAAQKLGARSLRSADPKMLEKNRGKLERREYECAYHVLGEIQRVIYGERALREGDVAQFKEYLLQSHESSQMFFKNSCAELDLLVDLARRQPGCQGARLSGGGFGGVTINLVEAAQVERFRQAMAEGYERATGRRLTTLVCAVADGAN